MAELADAGVLQPCVSIFPSITPAATASLITGRGPRDHGIQGAFWFDAERGDIYYFGDAPRVIAREGINDFFDDYLRTLNDDLLRVDTVFELAQAEACSTAGLNLMWRRGKTRHLIDKPLLTKLLPGVELADHVHGPDWLFLGDFVASDLDDRDLSKAPGGVTNRFGFNDEATLQRLEDLLNSTATPALTVAYFPDNDFLSHQTGAGEALEGLIDLDRRLLKIAETQGGVAKWLENTSLVVVGDHGHDDLVADQTERLIDLRSVLDAWSLTPPGQPVRPGDDLVVCPNMRAAQVRLANDGRASRSEVANVLLDDSRIDQVISPTETGKLRVETKGRGSLSFEAGPAKGRESSDTRTILDPIGREWLVEGDLAAINGKVLGQDRLVYGDYPDALHRLWDGAPGCQPSIWITARPGYEFNLSGTTTHRAGSHGSLHRQDSETVLITAGLAEGVEPPSEASIANIAGTCLASLGLHL